MKILLTTLNSKFIHTNLAIRYLREYTINNQLDYILKDIYKHDYDVVLFSTYIWNIYDIVKLCENLKKVKPEIKIGLGGPEVTYDSENAMEKYEFLDYILCGEGELVFRSLVEHFLGEKNIEDVKGIVYRKDGQIIVKNTITSSPDVSYVPDSESSTMMLDFDDTGEDQEIYLYFCDKNLTQYKKILIYQFSC